MARQEPAEKYSVPALARAFEILDILSMSSVGLTKMDVARQVAIPYSTAFNLLNTMEQHGYVRKDQASGRYYLGLKLLSLGNIQMRDVNVRDMAAPVLAELVRRTGLTAHLAILDRGEAIYIDKKEPEGFLKINSWIGKRNYVHTSAVGKALVADMDSGEVRRIWESGLPKRTANTVSSWKKFRAELAAVRTVATRSIKKKTRSAADASPLRSLTQPERELRPSACPALFLRFQTIAYRLSANLYGRWPKISRCASDI